MLKDKISLSFRPKVKLNIGSMVHFTAEEKFFFHSWLMIQKVIIIPGLLTSAETLVSGIPVYLVI